MYRAWLGLGLLLSLQGSTGVEPLGGSATGLSVRAISCINRTTGQVVSPPPAQTWDCESAGLIILSGDRVIINFVGFATEILTGVLTDWSESAELRSFGDGHHDVTGWWSINTTDRGWFYGSLHTGDSDVALAEGAVSVDDITDASALEYVTTFLPNPLCDADCDPDGVGEFVVWRNFDDFYGAFRVDDIFEPSPFDWSLNGTWWFQPDGSPNLADSIIGGHVTVGSAAVRFRCSNLTTGKSVSGTASASDIDCEAEGLTASEGDRIRVVVLVRIP